MKSNQRNKELLNKKNDEIRTDKDMSSKRVKGIKNNKSITQKNKHE